MAAITTSLNKDVIFQNGFLTRLVRESGTSGGTEDDTFTTTLARPKKLRAISIEYDANPTYTTDITVDLDSALGAAWDIASFIIIETGSGTQSVQYFPANPTAAHTGTLPLATLHEFMFAANDQLVITVPDGGGAILANVVVYWEELR